MGKKWIPKEKQHVYRALGDTASHLLIPAHGAGEKTMDIKSGTSHDLLASMASGIKYVRGELLLMAFHKVDQQSFFVIMGYETNTQRKHPCRVTSSLC